MKMFYSFLVLFMSILGFALPQLAHADTTIEMDLSFSVIVDDPTVIDIKNSNMEKFEAVKGKNTFTMKFQKTTYDDGGYSTGCEVVYFYIKPELLGEYLITGCDVQKAGEDSKEPFEGFYEPTNSLNITFNSEEYNGCTLYPKVSKLSDLPTTKVTINVDADDRVGYFDSKGENIIFKAGDNEVKFINSEYSLNLKNVAGYGITSVKNVTKKVTLSPDDWGEYTLKLTEENNADVFEIKTFDKDDYRTGEMSIWVDDASMVSIMYDGTYEYAKSLKDGDNVFKYDPEKEKKILIRSAEHHSNLYKVLVNGVEVALEYDSYTVECSPNNKVEIFANFPDVDVPVTFSFANEGTEAAILRVTENSVPKVFADGFTIKMGRNLGIIFNTVDYAIEGVTLNGEALTKDEIGYGYYAPVKSEKLDFVITATKYPTIPFTLTINDPKAVAIHRGNIRFTNLVVGENNIEISTAAGEITIEPNSRAKINSVTKNGKEVSYKDLLGIYYEIPIAEGDKIVVNCESHKREQTAYVYVKDATKFEHNCRMTRADYSDYNDLDGMLVTGENIVKFDAKVDNPFSLMLSGANIPDGAVIVFHNGVRIEPDYRNTFESIVLADGDKIYIYAPDEDPNAIEPVVNAVKNDAVYNLLGVKVNADNLPAGIYIKNGKKFIQKR